MLALHQLLLVCWQHAGWPPSIALLPLPFLTLQVPVSTAQQLAARRQHAQHPGTRHGLAAHITFSLETPELSICLLFASPPYCASDLSLTDSVPSPCDLRRAFSCPRLVCRVTQPLGLPPP